MGLLTWFRPEKRSATTTDQLFAKLTSTTTISTAQIEQLAALETAAGWIGRSFAAAEVRNVPPAIVRACNPSMLGLVGRLLTRKGEALFDLRISLSEIDLRPVVSYDVAGGSDPTSWAYRLDMAGPSRLETVTRTSEAVVHCKVNSDSTAPWRGRSAVTVALGTSTLAAAVEGSLRNEMKIPPSRVAPMASSDPEQRSEYLKQLKNGGLYVLQTPQLGAQLDPAGRGSYKPEMIRPDPASSVVSLKSDAAREVMMACGIPVGLFDAKSLATAREAYRQFLHGCIEPQARIVEAELREKLMAPRLSLSFSRLMASDLAGRARGFASLVASGMNTDKAAALAGLLGMEDE